MACSLALIMEVMRMQKKMMAQSQNLWDLGFLT